LAKAPLCSALGLIPKVKTVKSGHCNRVWTRLFMVFVVFPQMLSKLSEVRSLK